MKENSDKVCTLFCKLFLDLLQDLIVLYPTDAQLQMAQVSVNGLVLYDKKSFVKTVTDSLEPFYEKILEKDDKFFISLNFTETYENKFIKDELNRIRAIWINPDTTDHTRKCIWKYFTSFVKLGKILNST
jgi:hypothetical protein